MGESEMINLRRGRKLSDFPILQSNNYMQMLWR